MTLVRDEAGLRSETVRRANLSAIVRVLHVRGPVSRSELVARTGLTRSAIRSLIGELVDAGVVTEERAAPLGTPGRPSPLVRPHPEHVAVLALEIAVNSLAVAVVGLGGEVIRRVRIDRRRSDPSVEATVAELAELVHGVRARRAEPEMLVGAALSIVGVVRRTDGFVSMAPNLGWIDVPLGERLADALRLPMSIAVANDADLGALAESRRGSAVGADDIVFVSGEVGVGGGIIIDGKQLTGVAGYAGEIGHMPVNPNGRACHCGSIGCWETEIGADALLVRAGRPAGGGRPEVEAVLQAAAAGEPTALGAVEEVGRWLGFGLAGLVNVFDPRLIVLGGLFTQIHPFVAAIVNAQLEHMALAAPRRLVRVVPATLGVDAPLLGAAELAFEPFLADPAGWLRSRDAIAELASA